MLDRIDGIIFAIPFTLIKSLIFSIFLNMKKKIAILGSTGSIGSINS